MTEVLLVLVMYCGVPVAATIAYPTPEGPKVIVGPVAHEARATMVANADAIKAAGGRVEFIKVEEQVEGLRCPVST